MSNSRPTTADKRQTFRKLHESGCFVIPNPWNVGTRALSARPRLQGAGDDQLRPRPFAGLCRTARSRRRTCWRITASSPRRPTFRSTPTSRMALPTTRTASPRTSRAASRPALPGYRSRISPQDAPSRSTSSTRRVARVKAARAAIDQRRRRRGVHRARRGLHPRRARSRRRHPQAQGLSRPPAPTASTHPASGRASRSRRW